MDELRQLRDRHDAQPDPHPEVIAHARSRLAARISRPPAGKRPRFSIAQRVRPAWVLGLAGATALALVVAIMPTGPDEAGDPEADRKSPGPQPSAETLRLRPVANAQDLASNAAVLAAGEPDITTKPPQWAYIKSKSARIKDGANTLINSPVETTTHEMWRRTDEKRFAYIEDRKLKVVDGSEFEVTYPYLLALPTDPAALLARVYKDVDAMAAERNGSMRERVMRRAESLGKSPEEARRLADASAPRQTAEQRNTEAFQHITACMWDSVVPAKLRAAMYGAIAKIPGIRFEARAKDLAKRKGVTLYRLHSGHIRDEIFINPKTYEYMGSRSYATRDFKDTFTSMKKGRLIGWSSVIKATIVGEAGERP
jgi:hypothetical protein